MLQPLSNLVPPAAGTLFNSAGRLSHFYAYGARRLSGTLPASLCDARLLQELELSSCRLSGTLPTMGTGAASRSAGDTGSTRSLGSGMSSLRYLFLEANRISGVVPPSLANLHRLRELELSHNRLSGSVPRGVTRLRLDHLDFADNAPSLKGVPTSAPKQGCSGGSAKYLRAGGLPTTPWADNLPPKPNSNAAAGATPAGTPILEERRP